MVIPPKKWKEKYLRHLKLLVSYYSEQVDVKYEWNDAKELKRVPRVKTMSGPNWNMEYLGDKNHQLPIGMSS